MSEHIVTVEWDRNGSSFEYEKYPRDHRLHFDNGLIVRGSSAPEFLGNTECIDPEEALVAALSSCHMLTFLAVCSKKNLTVNRYHDHAVGFLEKNAAGKLAITKVILKPEVSFEGVVVNHEEQLKLHQKAHNACFIANSVNSEVILEPIFS